jgi:hypothetical protein
MSLFSNEVRIAHNFSVEVASKHSFNLSGYSYLLWSNNWQFCPFTT